MGSGPVLANNHKLLASVAASPSVQKHLPASIAVPLPLQYSNNGFVITQGDGFKVSPKLDGDVSNVLT
jgi:hypothetical protein